MSRLLVVGLATSLDRYAWLPQMRLGAINRPREVVVRAGGKGLNAARAAAGLGVQVRSVSLVGGETGRIVRTLADELDVRFVDSGVETRQCLCLLDDAGVLTEVYEPNRPVPPAVWPVLRDVLADEITALKPGDLLAVSGRVPHGLPADTLAQIVDLAATREVPVVVDSDGPALIEAARRGPALVKVNAHEAAAATHGATDPLSALRTMGARAVVVTHGASGAQYIGDDGTQLAVTHEPIASALPVGSGDAFLAGFAAHRLSGAAVDVTESLRIAAAAARANARRLPAGDITWKAINAELHQVHVESRPTSTRV
ncbi:PfkB family carbohydrate kinase [Dactylosporangium sp. NPDC005572]|uniref:1-phosphofructokinase family hexose kinase n=1 Tax=Dactylosporangium sp. NPDC005572 TaxID=3156889 RepID=UPI0033A58CE9